jgi:hypothetical protein
MADKKKDKKKQASFDLDKFKAEIEANNTSQEEHIVECPLSKLSKEFDKPKAFLKQKLYDLSAKYGKTYRLSGAFGKLSDTITLGKNGIRIAKKHFEDSSFAEKDKFNIQIEDDKIVLTKI